MLLLSSFLALFAGPLLVWAARSHGWSSVVLDSFCLVTITGFAVLHLLPESAAQAGWVVLPLAVVGFVLPTIAERTLRHDLRSVRGAVLVLALLGMAAHATLDGLLLHGDGHLHDDGTGHAHTHDLTAYAIILHRIPEGVGIWWIVPRTLGVLPALLVTLVSVSATLFGYFLGDHLLTDTSQRGLALLQSLLVGSLLHVVLHAHIPAPRERGRLRWSSVSGAALGAAVLWFVIRDHFPHHDDGGPAAVFMHLALESAPALLIAYLLVGMCHAFLPAHWLRSVAKGPSIVQALRGVAIGLPLPVCSCGVVPIYRELIRQGATLAAAIAFLVATPELELAAVTLTWQLMGGEVALVRAAMAAVLALSVGLLVAALAPKRAEPAPPPPGELPADQHGGIAARIGTALRFGFGPAVDNTATWILTGLLLSALLMPYVDREWLANLPPGIDVPIAALIGLPLYVCATGSTPLAAMLLVQGLSPGAVLALLLTGPATNITTFGMLARLHGGRVATAFALAMWLGAVGLGYVANLVLPAVSAQGFAHDHVPAPLAWLWLGLLAALFGWSLLRQGVRPFLERLFESPAHMAHDHDHAHAHGHAQAHAHSCCGGAPADDDDDHHHHHHHHAPRDDAGDPVATAPALPSSDDAVAGGVHAAPDAPHDGGCCGH